MSASNFKIALLAIALSPFILNAELREEFYEDEEDVAYTDDRADENEDGLYDIDADDDLADATYDNNDSYSDSDDRNGGCYSPYHRMHFGVRHTEARGVGYKDGYTTLEGFGIYDHNPNFMPFLDLRGHVFNNGKLAGNVGIGSRSVLSGINHIIGAYLYYDVRQENHNFTINQLSPGIELLGKRMEYRMNGYFPVGGHKSHKYGYEFNRFDGNNIRVRQKQKFALKGGDAEVGVHLTQSTKWDLYTGAGPYFFAAGGAHGWGGKVRLLGRYKEYISLEASYSYDRMFRNVVQGTIGFNYAFGKKLSRRDRNCPQQNDLMLSRAAFAPYRFEIPVVKKVRKNIRAINPATGLPWQVWFVNNTSSSAGTYQSPFPTLAQAQAASSANDMIYVFPGDGTTTGMNTGITLKDGQKLFGSSVAHKIKTTKGKLTIPAFSKTAPTITNTASVVTLANGNEVSGMNIAVNTLGIIGIDGSAGINGVTIDRNAIAGGVEHAGIDVLATGSVNIAQNSLTGPTTTSANRTGIRHLTPDTGFAKVKITQNSISGYREGVLMGVGSASATATANALVAENSISNFGSAGVLNTGGLLSPSSVMVTRNAINDTSSLNGIGVGLFVGAAAVNSSTYVFSNNSFTSSNSNAACTGIQAIVSSTAPSSTQMFISGNAIETSSGAGSVGISLESTLNNTLCTSITDNLITLRATAGGPNGIRMATSGAGVINIEDFSNNIAPKINITGNVNLVPLGTCSP